MWDVLRTSSPFIKSLGTGSDAEALGAGNNDFEAFSDDIFADETSDQSPTSVDVEHLLRFVRGTVVFVEWWSNMCLAK